jgi:hypothetical protein
MSNALLHGATLGDAWRYCTSLRDAKRTAESQDSWSRRSRASRNDRNALLASLLAITKPGMSLMLPRCFFGQRPDCLVFGGGTLGPH